jgi:putative endonuclease
LILKLKVSDYAHVVRLERKIKSMKSRIYIENLPKYPERQVKIIEETRKST